MACPVLRIHLPTVKIVRPRVPCLPLVLLHARSLLCERGWVGLAAGHRTRVEFNGVRRDGEERRGARKAMADR